MEMNCIVVDDERLMRESLARFIEESCPALRLVGKAADTDEARTLLATRPVDVIFCDIRMPRESGIDFLTRLDARQYHVVFVTAYNEYALEAIKARAFDYLLKPVDPAELKATVEALTVSVRRKRESEVLKKNYADTLRTLLGEIGTGHAADERLAIHHANGIVFLPVEDVLYLEGDGCYTVVHQCNGKKVVATQTLSEFEEGLPERQFFRIHKSFLVNLRHVTEYVRHDGFFMVLRNGEQLSIARRRLPAVLERMQQWTKG